MYHYSTAIWEKYVVPTELVSVRFSRTTVCSVFCCCSSILFLSQLLFKALFAVIEVWICVDLVSCRFSLISSCEWKSLSYLEAIHLGVNVPELVIFIFILFPRRTAGSFVF